MTKARDIADLGSNDVLDTTASGIDVTGSVTSDGLTVDGNGTIHGNSSELRIYETGGSDLRLSVTGSNTYVNSVLAKPLNFKTDNTVRQAIGSNGDITMYKDDGTTAGFEFDASTANVTVNGDIQLTETGNTTQSLTFQQVGGASFIKPKSGSNDGELYISGGQTATNRMKITTGGDIIFYEDDGSTAGMTYDASAGSVTLSGNLVVGNSGNINIPTVSSGNANLSYDGSNFNITSNSSSANINFQTSSTTRMTLGVGGDLTTYPLAGQNAIFNQDANDVDFTIRSSTNNSLFRADGGNSNIGINISEPTAYGAHIRGQGREFTDTIWDPYNESMPGDSDRDVATLYVESTSAAAANYGASIGFRGKSGNTVDRATYATIAGVKQNSTTDGSNSYTDQVQGCLDFYTTEGYSFSPNYGTRQKRRMRIDHYGRITTPYQPAFHAHRNSSYAVASSAGDSKLSANVASINRGNHYSTANSRFTAPVAGLYKFDVHLTVYTTQSSSLSSQDDSMYLTFTVNGAELGRNSGARAQMFNAGMQSANGVELGVSYSAIINLSANDYVETEMGDTSIPLTVTNVNFVGYLLG